MFLSKAFPYFLLALVALLSVASASGNGYLQPRQNDDDVSSSASESAASSSASASASRSSSSEAPTSSPSPSPSSSAPPSTSEQPSTSEAPSSTTSSEPQTTQPPESSAQQPTKTGVVTVIITTSGSRVFTSSSTIPTSAVASATGGVSQPDSSTSGGMSTQTKNTVIGVAVGVGGALILGALAIVFFRMRRKRNAGEDADELMSTGRYGHEKTGSVDHSPFKSTLDQYHNPAGRVNQSANF